MTPEGLVKRTFKLIVQTLQRENIPIWGFMPVSIGMGIHGIPDWVGVIAGRFVAVEFKAVAGKTTERQSYIHNMITKAGGLVYVVRLDNVDWMEEEFVRLASK